MECVDEWVSALILVPSLWIFSFCLLVLPNFNAILCVLSYYIYFLLSLFFLKRNGKGMDLDETGNV